MTFSITLLLLLLRAPLRHVAFASGAPGENVMLKMTVSQNGKVAGEAGLLLKLGQPGAVAIDGAGRIEVTVNRHPAPRSLPGNEGAP